jgi:hypothetical protein
MHCVVDPHTASMFAKMHQKKDRADMTLLQPHSSFQLRDGRVSFETARVAAASVQTVVHPEFEHEESGLHRALLARFRLPVIV